MPSTHPPGASSPNQQKFDSLSALTNRPTVRMAIGPTTRRFETGEAPYVSTTSSLLEATGYSPEIVAPVKPPAAPRVFELRVYHSPTSTQLRALHERFAGPETKIFHRCGIHPILYGSTVIGENMPNLTYLTPFDSLAAREKAWAAFGADPEWVKTRQESVQKYGQITAINSLAIYRAAAYSPIK